MTACPHEHFVADCKVVRLTEREGADGDPVRFTAALRVACGACNGAFAFKGVPAGLSIDGPPTCSGGWAGAAGVAGEFRRSRC